MRQLALAIATITVVATISAIARADMVGAAAGAGSGLVVAGPVGAVAGGVVGGVFGKPFWGAADQSRRMLVRQLLPTPLRASSSVLSLRVDWNYGFPQLRNIRRNPPRLVFDEQLGTMSALPPKADIVQHERDVRFAPEADSCTAAKNCLYSNRAAAWMS